MTPAEVVRIRERAAAQQRTASLAKRSRTLEKTSSLSYSAFALSPSLSAPRGSASLTATPARHSMAQMEQLSRIDSVDEAALDAQMASLDSLEQALAGQRTSLVADGVVSAPARVPQLAGGGPPPPAAPLAAVAEEADLEATIRALATEPDNDEERAEKYGVFERYLSTVERVRSETFKFWDDAQSEFAGGARRAADAELKRLDAPEAMGLSDDAFGSSVAIWFVQPMARQASRNNTALTRALAGLRTKLDLLSRQGDCPICLEPFCPPCDEGAAEPKAAETLPCCHKVCTDCWARWNEVRRGGAFCPLCRHAEFLDAVLGSGAP